jgi:16S rRNA (cytidine1402-2'-O)-methyltransferase
MAETLKDLAEFMPDRSLCVARELTKQFEEVHVQPASEWAREERSWRGELTLVLGPQALTAADTGASEADLDLLIAPRLSRGLSPKSVAEELAPLLRVSRRTIYQRALQLIADQA